MKTTSPTCAMALLLALFGLISGGCQNARETAVENGSGSNVSGTNAPAAAGSPARNQVEVKEDRFSITLPPGFPAFKNEKQSQTTGVGNIEMQLYTSESPRGDTCMLTYNDFPASVFKGRSPQKILEDGRDGALKNVGGVLERQESVTVQGHPGLSMYGSAVNQGRTIYFRFLCVLAQPQVFQLLYLTVDKSELNKPEVEAFFKSFRLEK